jgi:putative hydrolase of the HAD superfamily
MKIKAIIFDLGQVLDAPEDPEEARIRRAKLAEKLGLQPSELWTYLFEGEPSQLWMTGKISEQEFWNAVLGPNGIKDRVEVETFARMTFADTGTLNSEMALLLEELRGKYKLAVLSNASWREDELRELLYETMSIPEGTFDVIVSSNSVGVPKPGAEIYLYALEQLGINAEETIFTDDLANFTNAAADLGMNVHTFSTPAALRAYLVQMDILPVVAEKE